MNELQRNESVSQLIIWWNFVPYLSKSYKGKDCLFLFRGWWSQLIRRLSISITLKSLLLIVRIGKSSKSCVIAKYKRHSVLHGISPTLKYWTPPKILDNLTPYPPTPIFLKCTLIQKSKDSFFKETDFISNNEIRTHLNFEI